MTLVFDRRDELGDQPGMHVFIAGVSAYDHLPDGGGIPTATSFGMKQLSSTALTAHAIYEWLVTHREYLPQPLATCRLLLSPAHSEIEVEPALADLADPCTRANFVSEAKCWQADASIHPDNVAFFYFAGHGIQRTSNDAVLLLADFANPTAGGTLTNSAALNNLFSGMARSVASPRMASTQLYFVDACRVSPRQLGNFEQLTVPDVFDVIRGGIDDRRAPIFYAALPGAKAYALKNDQTLFSKSLIECLDGVAADSEENGTGTAKWTVTVYSLSEALEEQIEQMNRRCGYQQDFELGGKIKNFRLHTLAGPPTVGTTIKVEPDDALALASVEIRDGEGVIVQQLPTPVEPHPYEMTLPAGIYTVKAMIHPSDPRFADYTRSCRLKPVSADLILRVTP